MPGAKENEISEGRFFAVISYISFLCIVALLLKRDNKFALYHAKQGLVIFVCEVVALILSVIPLLGVLLRVFGVILFGFFSLWGISGALRDKYVRLPIVSNIADGVIL